MADSNRTSRATSSRAAEKSHDSTDMAEDIDFSPANLDTGSIPPREGYVQRWVRTKIGGEEDKSNVFRSANLGWTPRKASSVPQGKFVPTVEFNGDDIIGMHDTILMERPVEIDNKQKAYERKKTEDQMKAVESDMLKVHDPKSGMGRPVNMSSSKVSTGRVAPVSSD